MTLNRRKNKKNYVIIASFKSETMGKLINRIPGSCLLISSLPLFSSFPLNHSKRIVVSYKRKYVHKVLVNCLFKLAQEKKCG